MQYGSILCDYTSRNLIPIMSFMHKQQTILPYGVVLNHSHQLNGSICKYRDKMYYAYRTEQKPYFVNPLIHICEVDYRYMPVGETSTLFFPNASERGWRYQFKIECGGIMSKYRQEDPRLVVVGNDLYLVFGDGFKMGYTRLSISDVGQITVDHDIYPKPPVINTNSNHDLREKNWSPFDYHGELWFLYSYRPLIFCKGAGHDIIRHDYVDMYEKWEEKYGYMKGGTPLMPDPSMNGDYITFFHSTKEFRINQMNKNQVCYIIGAAVFDKYTLKPKRISRYPITIPDIEDNPNRLNKWFQVLFPAGLARENDNWLVSMGVNDCMNGILRVSKETLEYNLIDCGLS